MKDRPILFNCEMVRAILDDRKTQTRRVMRLQPDCRGAILPTHNGKTWYIWPHETIDGRMSDYFCACPYGIPGDRLWVRETWMKYNGRIIYRADQPIVMHEGYAADGTSHGVIQPWRPSIHMPRWASRITLEITGVRVERVQEITAQDALDEGIAQTSFWKPSEMEGRPFEEKWWDDFYFWGHYPQIAFSRLWDSNAKRGYLWVCNPWVWVIEFNRVSPKDCERRK